MFCPRQEERTAPASAGTKTAADQQKISAWPDQRAGCGTDRAAQADQAGKGQTQFARPNRPFQTSLRTADPGSRPQSLAAFVGERD